MQRASGLEQVIAVGDVRADLDALLRILSGLALIDDHGRWAGAACRLVFLGDMVDRGVHSAAVLSYVMALEREAAAGGEFVVLLGNHEVMVAQGLFHFLPAAGAQAAADYPCGRLRGRPAVYRGDSPWARWIGQRVRLGPTLFAHAGLDARMRGVPLDAINRGVCWRQLVPLLCSRGVQPVGAIRASSTVQRATGGLRELKPRSG